MLSIGCNRKLSPGRIAVFNLPAARAICGRNCGGCYARKAQVYPTVRRFRWRNYRAAQRRDWVERIVAEVKAVAGKILAVRVHESGEFFSQQYVDNWVQVARALPGCVFYAYTKRLAELDFSRLRRRPNFVLINSLQYGVNYGDARVIERYRRRGARVCPAVYGRVSCGSGCNYCLTKVAQRRGVVFHRH
jgi:hypothetical protein